MDQASNPNYATILISIIILGFSLFAAKVVNWLWLRPKKIEKILIKHGFRGNPYRPPLGDFKDLISFAKREQPRPIEISDDPIAHALPYYHHQRIKYGENSFLWLGPTPKVMVSDPQFLKEILAKPNIFHKPSPDPIGQTIVGGLLYLEDEQWAKHRKIINPAFHMEKLKNMVPTIYLSCSNMINKWESLFSSGGEKRVIDVWQDLENLSGDIISRTAFGSSHDEGRRIFELQNELVKLVLEIAIFTFIPGWRYIPTKANRRVKAITKEIHTLLVGIIKQREKALKMGEAIGEDLLGALMESNAKEIQEHGNKKVGVGLSLEDVIEECKLFYFAGSETTSSLLVWTMIMLSIHKEWQTRAREEVFLVFGKKEPTLDGLNHLKTVTMILHEVLRLYTPIPLTSRSTTKSVKLGDKTLPAGLDLLLFPGLLHHDPKIWGNDFNEFKPERFSQGILSASKSPSSFIPFSSGPRVCIGQHFAMIEAKLALVMILQHFSFELSETYLHAPFSILTLRPQYGAPLLLQKLG